MNIYYSDKKDGTLKSMDFEARTIPFNPDFGPKFVVDGENVRLNGENGRYCGSIGDVFFCLEYKAFDEYCVITAKIKNLGKKAFRPCCLELPLGIDTYMGEYPERNEKVFPTMLRCEKTHFYGYFSKPNGEITAVACPDAIKAYNLKYNEIRPEIYGHRIHTASLILMGSMKLPERYPSGFSSLDAWEELVRDIFFIPVPNGLSALAEKVSKICKIPIIASEKYTVSKGEKIELDVTCTEKYNVKIFDPEGSVCQGTAEKNGIYKTVVSTESGKTAEACFFCRKDWSYYLKTASQNVVKKPQHACTHAEGWYGYFSAYLCLKHFPNVDFEEKIDASFEEVLPLMFDFEKCEPLCLPERVQNTSTLISLLVDKYEANKSKNKKWLITASRFGDWLTERQTEDGAYRRKNIHYTCVIYPAKSMLELSNAEREAGMLKEAERHFESAKRAVDDLVERLDNISTEGEQTLEEGMISCSALQIALFALSLPMNERKKYIAAAEHMDKIHRSLELLMLPDCRSNGASVRFWEGQYDVMILGNFINSPHGWTAWTAYAKYYLYLLTGKIEYLKQLFNTLGSCVQLIGDNGDLRWAFALDPYIKAKRLRPDTKSPIKDGYKTVNLSEPAFLGSFEKEIIGEEYIDMISGWYRNGEQLLTGGFYGCPLFLKNETLKVDNQGGACDNDVHEIFKCVEETVLKKIFVYETAEGRLECMNGRVTLENGKALLESDEETDYVCTNFSEKRTVVFQNMIITAGSGVNIYKAHK